MQEFPSWLKNLLHAGCPNELVEQIEGDLIEIYNHDVKSMGERKARLRLTVAALRFLRPGILFRKKIPFTFNQSQMLRSYFKTICRHLFKSKLTFTFKVGGLVLAFTSLLAITIYVSHQRSFDRFHDDYQNIYRVNSNWKENDEMAAYAVVPTGIGPALKEAFPEIKSFTRINPTGQSLVKYNDKLFQHYGFVTADTSVFNVFSFEFIAGDKHALDHSGSIVLTQSTARKIFADEDPLGKSIFFAERPDESFHVTAVIKDIPGNSHLVINALLPFDALRDGLDQVFDPWSLAIDGLTPLYIRFYGKNKPDEFISKANPLLQPRIKAESNPEYTISLQPVEDIYLAPAIYAEFNAKGNAVFVYVFSLLGIFLLLISSINYVNLSVADFHKRNREFGVRKVMGAKRIQIAFQVTMETFLICFASLLFSIAVLYFLFPQVLRWLDPELRLSMLFKPDVMIFIGVMLLLLIIFSTSYPAYRLAMNKAGNDLKSKGGFGKNSTVSEVLLLSQFVISVVCITATFIVGQQLEFIQTSNPGYDRHNMIVVYMPDRYPPEKIQVIKDEFKKVIGVEGVSYSAFRIAGSGYYRDWYRVEMDGEMRQVMLNEVFFDHDFFKVTGIPLVAGRTFDPTKVTDAHEAFIVNETAVREFGWTDPIGKRISYGYEETEGEKWEGTVVGVVKDFNVYSLHKKIEPLVMRLPWSDWPGNCIHIRIIGPLDKTIARIKNKYEEIMPGFLLNYSMIEDIYNDQYENERRTFATLQLSTWVIVIISSLGVFSLSLYISLSRMKEFGIRKVLGATAREITFLHAGKFLKIGLVANVLALPLAWMLMYEWLGQFAYKTDLSSLSFVLIAMSSLLLVLLSAGYAAWRSGQMNPVEVIKSE